MNPIPVSLELPSGRARLEPLTPDHAPSLLEALLHDIEIWRYMPETPPATPDLMARHVRRALDSAASAGNEIPFAIVDRATGRCAGATRYLDIQRANRGLEIGWTWLGAPWRRTSINTECKYLLLRHAFESLGALRVQLRTDGRNERSQRAILRIGAAFEGRFRKARVLYDGYIRDNMFYSVIDDEWPAVKARLESSLAR